MNLMPRYERLKLKKEVALYLRRGKHNAIRGEKLAKLLGHPNDRQIRIVIREMISNGIPVAASVGKPMGFYIADNYEEALEYMAVLRRRCIENAVRRRDFKKACLTYLEPKQLVMGGIK